MSEILVTDSMHSYRTIEVDSEETITISELYFVLSGNLKIATQMGYNEGIYDHYYKIIYIGQFVIVHIYNKHNLIEWILIDSNNAIVY